MVRKRKATFTPTDPRGMAAREELIPPVKREGGAAKHEHGEKFTEN